MTLGELMGPEAKLPGRLADDSDIGPDRRQPRREARLSLRRAARIAHRRLPLHRRSFAARCRCDPRAARRRAGAERHPRGRGCRSAAPDCRSSPRASSARSRTSPSPSPAPTARRRSRPSSASSGSRWDTAPRASAPSAWSDRQARKFSPTPRLTPSSFTASSPISPNPASPILPSKRRAMGSSSAASTACGLPPAPSPTSRATISTITRASRPISTRSSACSANCCRLAPAPSSMWTPRPGKRLQRLPNRAASR